MDVERALAEIKLSDSFNTQINQKMTPLLNYKLTDRKYTDLPPIDVDPTKDLALVYPKKSKPYVPREKKDSKVFKPDLKDFWSHNNFVTENPFCDFEKHFEDDTGYGMFTMRIFLLFLTNY